ncbi:potassium channel family protein [Cribrihabitans neustonicus]|uniref:potassium channel family protein n=1 Tax=Cribrihabitans neustonicus TaxID=1429085 RepID=UPI003B5BAE0E
MLNRLILKMYRDMLDLRLWLLALLCLAFVLISWGLFLLAGETALTSSALTFLYFAATTASTVGYGDLSPQTHAGRLVAALWFFPGALLIFSAVLGRLAGAMVERIRRMAEGQGSFETLAGATVIVGYQREQTPLIVENLIAGQDGDEKIVLLTKDAEAEVPQGVHLVRTERLDALASLRRAAIPLAQKALVFANSDAETFNACLAIRELNQSVHVAAFFEDRDTARRAARIAEVETVVSNASEALVRAAQDPGAGQILMALSAANVGATIYSARVGGQVETARLEAAITACDGTLIAVSQPEETAYVFRPFPQVLKAQGIFYYLAAHRLPGVKLQEAMPGAVPVIV